MMINSFLATARQYINYESNAKFEHKKNSYEARNVSLDCQSPMNY